MRLFFIALLLCFARLASAATGDILGVEVQPGGWHAYVWIDGFGSNTVFNNGFLNRTNYGLFGTNEIWYQINSAASNGLKITLSSKGYTDGVWVDKTRVVYGTDHVRLPYPLPTTNEVVVSGGVARVRVALSDWVYTNDTALSADIYANGFMDGATPCSGASGWAATNSSTFRYLPVIPQWTIPGWTRETNATMRVSAVAFHHHGIDSMHFIATDEAGNKVTNQVSRMSPDRTRIIKGIPWADYNTDISLATLDDGDQVRLDFVAFPKIGDAGALFDTRSNTFTGYTYLPTSITNLIDKTTNLVTHIAVVSPAGNDTNGRATNTSPANVDSSHYFLTPAAAALFCLQSNSYNGAYVFIRTDGGTNFSGTAQTYASEAKSYVEFHPYPGDETPWTIYNRSAGSQNIAGRMKFVQCNLAITNGTMTTSVPRIWFEDSVLQPLNVPFRGTATPTLVWIHNSTILDWESDMRAFSTDKVVYFVLGSEFNGGNYTRLVHCDIGNISTNTTSVNLMELDQAQMGMGPPTYQILYNNRYLANTGGTSSGVNFDDATGCTNVAIVQNEFEGIKLGAGSVPKSFSLFNSDVTNYNIAIHGNTSVGYRAQFMYNNNLAAPKLGVSFKNNAWDTLGWVSDDESGVDGNMIGNWPVQYAVGFIGNAVPNTAYASAAIHDNADYFHLQNYWRADTVNRKPPVWFGHVLRNASSGGADPAAGNGDYNWQSGSPVMFLPTEKLYDYDINLLPRGTMDPPGASASGNAKKGMFF